MAIWSESMEQTYEYYIVNPNTWKDEKQLLTVKSCTVNRDSEADTLGSATIDIDEDIGECYIRVYLIVNQNGVKEKIALGTFLVQTPSVSFDGKTSTISLDAYTPLLELKEGMPPIGYYIGKEYNIMDAAYTLVRENARAPVIKPNCETTLYYNFVSDTSDTWLSFLTDLIADVKYIFSLDELGRISFAPKQDTASLRPVWTYTDDNSSILYPELSLDHDLYGIPNVVEVVYSNGADSFYAKVVNDDPNSPISTVKRGREIVHRVTDPELISDPKLELFYYKTIREEHIFYRKIDDGLHSMDEDELEETNRYTVDGEKIYKHITNPIEYCKAIDSDGWYMVEEHKEVVYIRQNEKFSQKEGWLSIKVSDAKTVLNETVWCTYLEDHPETAEYYCEVWESYQVKEYAIQLLKELSTIEYTISYTHGYCPVRLGDCVMLNYEKAGLTNIKAKVVNQSIKCEPGCPVTEKAVFTNRLWR